LLKKKEKKKERKKREKRELCSAHPKGFGQQQFSVGAIGVHLSTSYILFPLPCFPLHSAT